MLHSSDYLCPLTPYVWWGTTRYFQIMNLLRLYFKEIIFQKQRNHFVIVCSSNILQNVSSTQFTVARVPATDNQYFRSRKCQRKFYRPINAWNFYKKIFIDLFIQGIGLFWSSVNNATVTCIRNGISFQIFILIYFSHK